jgi:AraC-like DNA-binding protein
MGQGSLGVLNDSEQVWYVLTIDMESPMEFQRDFFRQNPGAWSVLELFDSLPNAFFYSKDRESRFVRVNRAFLQSHGVESEDQIVGKTDRDFSPPVFAEAYIAEDRRVMAGRRPIAGQLWLVFHHPGLRPHWYSSTKVPMFNPDGEVIGIAGAMYLIEQPEEQARYFGALGPVIRHMERCYGEAISMQEMADLAGLSATHFNRRFQQLLRSTPTDHLRSIRVQVACRLLSTTRRSLSEIAMETGFTDQSHFTRCFRESTGLTPRAYRLRFQRLDT